jgi:hypothetical protein
MSLTPSPTQSLLILALVLHCIASYTTTGTMFGRSLFCEKEKSRRFRPWKFPTERYQSWKRLGTLSPTLDHLQWTSLGIARPLRIISRLHILGFNISCSGMRVETPSLLFQVVLCMMEVKARWATIRYPYLPRSLLT